MLKNNNDKNIKVLIIYTLQVDGPYISPSIEHTADVGYVYLPSLKAAATLHP